MVDPATIILGAGGNLLSSVGSALFGNSLGRQNEERLWNERYSPQAQVRNLAAAGINPAVAMGNQSPVLTAGGRMDIPDVSSFGIGTTALSEMGNYFNSLANAKKAGAEEKNVSVQTEKALTEIEAQKMQNEFTKKYGNQKWLLDLSTAYQNVLLAQKTNDIKEQEKAINEWKKASEKAISEANEHQRDMLKKDLDNKDEEIRLSNNLLKEKAKTEKSSQSANYASAGLAKAQTKTEDATRDYKAFAIDLANHMQGLEYGFNLDTYQQRLEKFAHEVGIVKWTEFLNSVEAKDREAYNAIQRIIMGKGTKEDGKSFWNLVNDGRQLIPFK